MKTPGERIREERIRLKWPVQKLADEISKIKGDSITRAAVSLWEIGSSKTQKPENLFAAAQALGLNPKWVLNESGDKHVCKELAAKANPRLAHLIKILDGQPDYAEISGKRSGFTPQLAKLYNVSADWLATGKGSKELGIQPAAALAPPIPLEEQAARLLAEMPYYLADAWFSRVKGHADTLRAEKRAAQEARHKREEGRTGAVKSSAGPPIVSRRTA